jgi:iron complex transport system substrate-binding protein
VAAVVVLGELLLVASIDWLIEATGSVNVATEIGVVGPANITAEALIAAAPDVLLVTTDGIASVGGTDALLSMLMTRLAAEEAESTKENP